MMFSTLLCYESTFPTMIAYSQGGWTLNWQEKTMGMNGLLTEFYLIMVPVLMLHSKSSGNLEMLHGYLTTKLLTFKR